MGFQWLRLGQQKMESISKARCDENGDWLTVVKSPATTNLQLTKGSDPTNPKDGTLDINYIAWTMRSAVGEVARHFPTAIISGRCRDKVYKFVQLANLYYAGSHGMDIMLPLQPIIRNGGINKFQTRSVDENGREAVLLQPAKEFLPTIQEIFRVLQERTKVIHGVMIENNRFCLSVHFRRVSHEDWSKLEELVKSVAMQYPQFCLTRGRKVMEIRPSIKWDKGHALEYLLDTLGFGNSTDVLPLYIGDDLSDEDAFQVLQRRGQGYPIIVSSIPKDTKASYSLRDPPEVMAFLLCLARWKRNSSSNSLQL